MEGNSKSRVTLKALPVLYTCQGCEEFGQAARDAGAALDRAARVEMVWLGARADLRPSRRYPILALDGCSKACVVRWLERHGRMADRSYILPAMP